MADGRRLDVPRARTRSIAAFVRLNPDAVGRFAEGIARFNRAISAHSRLTTTIVPLRDGISLSVKTG